LEVGNHEKQQLGTKNRKLMLLKDESEAVVHPPFHEEGKASNACQFHQDHPLWPVPRLIQAPHQTDESHNAECHSLENLPCISVERSFGKDETIESEEDGCEDGGQPGCDYGGGNYQHFIKVEEELDVEG
jgi:hypothetical protein